MASFVVDWTVPTSCTSAIRLSKRVTVLNGGMPLMNADLNVVFRDAEPGMVVILQEKTEKWSGIIESKWDSYKEARDREEKLLNASTSEENGDGASSQDAISKSPRKAALAGRAFVKQVTSSSEAKSTQDDKQKGTGKALAKASVAKKRPSSSQAGKKTKVLKASVDKSTVNNIDSDSSEGHSDNESIDLELEKQDYLKKLKEKTKKARSTKSKKGKDQGKEQVKKAAQQEAVLSFLPSQGKEKTATLEIDAISTPRQLYSPQASRRSPRLNRSPSRRDLQSTPLRYSSQASRSSPRLTSTPSRRDLQSTPLRYSSQASRSSPRLTSTPSRRDLQSPPLRYSSQASRNSPRLTSTPSRRDLQSPPLRYMSKASRSSPRLTSTPSRRDLGSSKPRQQLRDLDQSRSLRTSPRQHKKNANEPFVIQTPSRRLPPSPSLSSTPRKQQSEASTSGSSIHETGNEEALHEALNCMHSAGKRPMGIEECLSNCEKVLRLLLQVQLAMLQNCSKTEQKEDEENVGQLDSGLKKKARDACKSASTPGDAVRSVARILFAQEELLTCTVRGRHTNKSVEQRKALDATKMKFLISTVTKVFTTTKEPEINTILGDFLKKNRSRSATKKSQ